MPLKANTDEINSTLDHLESEIEEAEKLSSTKESDKKDPFSDAAANVDEDSAGKIKKLQDTAKHLREAAKEFEETDLEGSERVQKIAADELGRTQSPPLTGLSSQMNSASLDIAQQQAMMHQQRQLAQQQAMQQQWAAQQQAMQQQQWAAQQQAMQQQWAAQQQAMQQQQWVAQQQAMQQAAQQAAQQTSTSTAGSGGANTLSNEDFANLIRAVENNSSSSIDNDDAYYDDEYYDDEYSDSPRERRDLPEDMDLVFNSEASNTVIIGDSTTEQLKDALASRLDEDGVPYTIDSKGGRAIIEGGDGSGLAAIRAQKEALDGGGKDINWFIGLGVNDANNIAANSGVDQTDRIDQVMEELSDQGLVYWPLVDISPDANTGYDLAPEVEEFNEALREAENRYDNLRVVSWSASDSSYTDGIHYNQTGMDQRVDFIADTIG